MLFCLEVFLKNFLIKLWHYSLDRFFHKEIYRTKHQLELEHSIQYQNRRDLYTLRALRKVVLILGCFFLQETPTDHIIILVLLPLYSIYFFFDGGFVTTPRLPIVAWGVRVCSSRSCSLAPPATL